MAYFLKKTKRNDRLYLSIYESFYSPETKNTRLKVFVKSVSLMLLSNRV